MTRLSRDLIALGLGACLALGPTAAGAEAPAAEPETSTAPAESGATPPAAPSDPAAPAPPAADASEEQRAAVATTDAPEPQEPVADADPTSREVDDAVLRWGLNDESNNRAFAPGTINLLSAGKVPDPGRGGSIMPASGWSARTGDVAVEKWDGSAYRPATWAGLRTDATGAPIGNGRFSGHQLVFSGGEGTIDADSGSARLRWDGDASVVYYSGMSFFYLSDPELVVADGVGRVTAELGGFSSSMEDLTQWGPVTPERVVVADLGEVELDGDGFTRDPAFDGVRVSGVPQVAPYGSFPQSFVDFQGKTGTSAYWYTSGGAADPWKKALPLTVGWGDAMVEPPAPETPAAPLDPVENEALAPPPATVATAADLPVAANVPPGLAAPAPPDDALRAAGPGGVLDARPVASLVPAAATAPTGGSALWWWLTAVLLTLAAGCVLGTLRLTPAPASPRG